MELAKGSNRQVATAECEIASAQSVQHIAAVAGRQTIPGCV